MNEESFITFTCPHCGRAVDYLEDYAGSAQPCPHCSEDIVVPGRGDTEGRNLPLPMETTRLILRRLQEEDLWDIIEILSNPEIFRLDERAAMTDDESKAWLSQAVKDKLSDAKGELNLGIVQRSDQKLVGLISMKYFGWNRLQARLAIQINRNFQRQGIGAEAFWAAVCFCLRDIGLHRVSATCDSRNVAAVAMLTKLGLRQEAECLRDSYIDGEWTDTRWFAMLAEEFPRGS
jgi:[ribosomal protein S5]-alanine N-acetyltransferase